MLRLYERNVDVYRESLGRLRGLQLEDKPEAVCEVAARMMGMLLGEESEGRKHYSFASKLFHWHAPHHLPIVDSRARKAIRKLQGEWGEPRCARVSGVGQEWREDYPRWIRFYARLICKLTASDREALRAADCESLPQQFRRENTLLRVLDKVFWMRGKEKSDQG